MRAGDSKKAVSKSNGRNQKTQPNFRFPCGHEEHSDSLNQRMRTTERAAWVRCRACNVIGLRVTVS